MARPPGRARAKDEKFFAIRFRHPNLLIVNTVDALRALLWDISLIETFYYNYESSYYTLVIVGAIRDVAWAASGFLSMSMRSLHSREGFRDGTSLMRSLHSRARVLGSAQLPNPKVLSPA
jgi:hypothetical protein